MKKHTFGLAAAVLLAVVATASFAFAAQKTVGPAAGGSPVCSDCCNAGDCCTK